MKRGSASDEQTRMFCSSINKEPKPEREILLTVIRTYKETLKEQKEEVLIIHKEIEKILC